MSSPSRRALRDLVHRSSQEPLEASRVAHTTTVERGAGAKTCPQSLGRPIYRSVGREREKIDA